ncbi:sialomucin core protein 24 isoform X1 [Mobula birostris]|uniref:sialomucin core protein 24 isoform X1 n=1 Tax=Mobula birostris TaxID=1983395 RepID=UPI003B286788
MRSRFAQRRSLGAFGSSRREEAPRSVPRGPGLNTTQSPAELGFHPANFNLALLVHFIAFKSPSGGEGRGAERQPGNMKRAGIAVGVSVLLLFCRVGEGQAAECAELETCTSCITGNALLNLTDCVWVHCQSEMLCIAKDADNLTDCTIYNESSTCNVLQLTSVPTTTITSTTTVSSTTAVIPTTKDISTMTAEPAPTTEVPTTAPVYSPSSFDPASFIGGMVLVLGAEAAFFFAIKFFKARDGTYQTLI